MWCFVDWNGHRTVPLHREGVHDLAATIFDLVGATVPTEYVLDGQSYLDDTVRYFQDDGVELMEELTVPDTLKCIDIVHSHSMVTGRYQYIFRATPELETGASSKLYPNTYDVECFSKFSLLSSKITVMNMTPWMSVGATLRSRGRSESENQYHRRCDGGAVRRDHRYV